MHAYLYDVKLDGLLFQERHVHVPRVVPAFHVPPHKHIVVLDDAGQGVTCCTGGGRGKSGLLDRRSRKYAPIEYTSSWERPRRCAHGQECVVGSKGGDNHEDEGVRSNPDSIHFSADAAEAAAAGIGLRVDVVAVPRKYTQQSPYRPRVAAELRQSICSGW